MGPGTLIIFILSIESSYSQNIERDASNRFDTVQWWIGESGALRIKTFAIDSDIHLHEISPSNSSRKDLINLAIQNTEKHYGDVIKRKITINILPQSPKKDVEQALTDNGLSKRFDWHKGSLIWFPDDSEYKTQSQP